MTRVASKYKPATSGDAPFTLPIRFPVLAGRDYAWLKRLLDLILVIGTLPLWLPLTAVVALAVKLEQPGGPVLFIQERTGKGGKRFRMYKFRTMVVGAEAMKEELAAASNVAWPDFKLTRDPRVTRIGRFLRKSSLDELPQLVNVLAGQMTLVGPRPTSFAPDTYELWQSERLDVQPGLTGLWQISGRGEIEFDQRVRLDINYIKHRSLGLDLKILLWTVPRALRGS